MSLPMTKLKMALFKFWVVEYTSVVSSDVEGRMYEVAKAIYIVLHKQFFLLSIIYGQEDLVDLQNMSRRAKMSR